MAVGFWLGYVLLWGHLGCVWGHVLAFVVVVGAWGGG
jgi:hypothetical protein